jgi:glycerol-3-phosphate acyltransferase PlsY
MQWVISVIAVFISLLLGYLPFGYVVVRVLHRELPELKLGDITANGVRQRFGWGWALVDLLADVVKCIVGSVIWLAFWLPMCTCSLMGKLDEHGNLVRDLAGPYWRDVWLLSTALLLFLAALAGHAWHHWRKPKTKMQPANS